MQDLNLHYVNVANYKCLFLYTRKLYPRSVITRRHSNKLVNYHLYTLTQIESYMTGVQEAVLHWSGKSVKHTEHSTFIY